MTDLTIEGCDPRNRADEIKALFARNGRPEFDAVFERAYRSRAQAGLRSWLGVVDGRVTMHISVSPQPFRNGSSTLMGGVLGDLMADEPHRNFWSPLRLLRTAVGDLKRRGGIDFLMTTSTPVARSLFTAGGFKEFGQLRRYVFPLLAPYVAVARLRSGARSPTAMAAALNDPGFAAELPSLGSAGHWRAQACQDFYATRIPREHYADGTWLRVGDKDGGPARAWGLLCRHSHLPEVGLADAYWRGDDRGFRDIAISAAQWGRANRLKTLSISTLEGSRVAREVSRAGFLARPYVVDILMQPLGGVTLPPQEDWFLTGFVGSAW